MASNGPGAPGLTHDGTIAADLTATAQDLGAPAGCSGPAGRGCASQRQGDGMPGPGLPQDVLAPPAHAAIFLVVTVRPGAEDDVSGLLADVAGLRSHRSAPMPATQLSPSSGARNRTARVLPRPAGLHPFPALAGAVHTAVSTPGDLLFHLRARRLDLECPAGGGTGASVRQA
ncbi:MAG: Dyp-type peroxidase domain-containing protein [Streptosporangiaceae bacterium]